MTTITYRDGVLASDSRMIECDVVSYQVQKIHKINDRKWCAFAGNYEAGLRWLDCVKNGREFNPKKGDAIEAIMIDCGNLYSLSGTKLCRMDVPYYAIGSGTHVALGAMFIGANAIEAVRAATEHDPKSGGKVKWVKVK